MGPTIDFTRMIVQMMNASGQTKLGMRVDVPPIIDDIPAQGDRGAMVRARVCVVDELTGVAKWAVKEEVRRGTHAATVAMEKAEGKALNSHPSFNRKLVRTQIEKFLRRCGLNPKDFQIGGSTGPWGDFFARAAKAGVDGETLRQSVKQRTGKGLSEIQTPAEVAAATEAVDRTIREGPPPADPGTEPKPSPEMAPGGVSDVPGAPLPEDTPPPPPPPQKPPAEDPMVVQLRTETLAVLARLKLGDEVIKALWHELGPGEGKTATVRHYQRMRRVAGFLDLGAPIDTAIAMSKTLYPVEEGPRP